MHIEYARVSKKDEQDVRSQVEALQKAECERIFYEEASDGRWDRPELHKLLDQLRPDDVVIVWKLDRLSRSLKDLIAILERIEKARAASLTGWLSGYRARSLSSSAWQRTSPCRRS